MYRISATFMFILPILRITEVRAYIAGSELQASIVFGHTGLDRVHDILTSEFMKRSLSTVFAALVSGALVPIGVSAVRALMTSEGINVCEALQPRALRITR